MSECAKCRKTKGGSLVGCEGTCRRWFHHSCVGIDEAQFKMLEKSHNMFFMCNECKLKCIIVDQSSHVALQTDVERIKNDLLKLSDIENSLESLKEELVKQFESSLSSSIKSIESSIIPKFDEIKPRLDVLPEPLKPSYSKVLSKRNSVVVMPKQSNQRNATTKAELLQNINPVDSNICVSKVKNVSNGGVVVSCSSDEEVKKFKEIATNKMSEKYEVKEVSSLHPRIKIVGLTEKLDEEPLIHNIKIQNKDLFNNESCDIKLISFSSTKKKE